MPNSYRTTSGDELQRAASSSEGRSAPCGVLRRMMDRLSRLVSDAIHRHKGLFAETTMPISLSDNDDEPSDAEVTHALETWIAKAQQIVPSVAEYFARHLQFEDTMGRTEGQVSATQRVSGYIIPDLLKSFGTKTWEDVSASLQIALEACLAFSFYQTATSWASGRGSNAKSLLIDGISDVLLVAGCTSLQSDVISKITLQFEEKIVPLFNTGSGRLGKMLDELTRSGLELFIVRPGATFECKSMEDADGGNAQGGSVLCTTCVGLMERVPTETETGRERVTVLKAKVLLDSFLD